MTTWWTRILSIFGFGLAWAVAWAAVGALIAFFDAGGFVGRRWLGPPIGFLPGFVSGALCSAFLGLIAGQSDFARQPRKMVLGCGAVAGLIVGALPFVINAPPGGVPLWQVGLLVMGSMTLLGALSAALVQVLAQTLRRRNELRAE